MAAGSWFDWTTGDLVTEAKFQDIQDSILFIYASDAAANSALTNKVEGTVYFNTTDDVLKVWDGSAWQEVGAGIDAFAVEYVVVAGGGGGNTSDNVTHGAGGAGGYLSNVNGENSGGGNSALPTFYAIPSTNYEVEIGAGGGVNGAGNSSIFGTVISVGGGRGHNTGFNLSGSAGSPNGKTSGSPTAGYTNNIQMQGYESGDGVALYGSGGAGGAGAAGSDGTNNTGGNGGNGVASSITGSSVTRAGGGGGGGGTTGGTGGSGGGGNGGAGQNASGTSGTVNTGGGGGGSGWDTGGTPGSGGSGIVILKYPDTYTISVGAGLTSSTSTSGGFSVTSFTAGSDTVSWS